MGEVTKSSAELTGAYVSSHVENLAYFADLKQIKLIYGTFLNSLSRNTRQRINRALRLYKNMGKVRITPASSVEEALEFLEHLKRYHQSYWRSRNLEGAFSHVHFERFLNMVIRSSFADGIVDLLKISAGEVEIGYLVNFVYQSKVYQYQSGFCYDEPKLIPGYVSHALAIEYYLEKGMEIYNFLAGHNQQKSSLSTGSEPLYWLTLQRDAPYQGHPFYTALEYFTNGAPGKTKNNKKEYARSSEKFSGDKKAMVVGDDVRSFLGVVRSLGRKGIVVDCCYYDESSPALKSAYIRNRYRLPSYTKASEAWVEKFRTLLDAHSYDLVIPCDDRSIIPLMSHKAFFSDHVIALPNEEAYDLFYDKHETRVLAAKVNVPIVRGRLLCDDDTAEAIAEEFGIPLALKPRRSYLVDNAEDRQSVEICKSLEQLRENLNLIRDRRLYFIESFFEGIGVGVSILAREGRILQAFEHHRVQEPFTGGGSSYRVSQPLDERMLGCVARLVEGAHYTGVGMFEFRLNKSTGDFVLLEVNARFWGSLPLAIASGVDFPYLLYRSMVDKVDESRVRYRNNFFGRNVISDVYYTVESFMFLKSESRIRAYSYLIFSFLKWYRVVIFREKHDSFSFDDPVPGLEEYKNLLSICLRGIRKLFARNNRTVVDEVGNPE